jgi:hypothetical protein
MKKATLRPAADKATLRHVAAEAARFEPPAAVVPPKRSVLINVRLAEETAIALAKRAHAEGLTQKAWLARVLAEKGLPVHPADLEDRRPPRRWEAA